MLETTALGAAIAAGLYVGIWKNPRDMALQIGGSSEYGDKFLPKMDRAFVDEKLRHWTRAVERSLGWIETEERIKQAGSIISRKIPSFVVGFALGSLTVLSIFKYLNRSK